ncbi:chemotaxis protein [Brachyspira hyodysenteriae]|nr:methyl-accepting chemotaxis protein [Brachyspira hyodysenteriae]KLI54125.1 chemotaxis protein [Brachyspira hyodysenteriae]
MSKNKKIYLMIKFILPFAIFLTIMYFIILFVYRNIYINSFFNNKTFKAMSIHDLIESKLNNVNEVIDVLDSYLKIDDLPYEYFGDAITNISQLSDDYMNIYFGDTVPYPTGGIFINSLEPFPTDYDQTSRGWYKSAVANNKKIYITDPYVDFATKKICITFAKAIYTNNTQLKGVVAIDFGKMDDIVQNTIYEENVNLVTKNGMFINNTDKNKVLSENYKIFNDINFPNIQQYIIDGKNYTNTYKDNWYMVQKLETVPWSIVLSGNLSQVQNQIKALMFILLLVLLIIILLESILVVIIVNPITASLDQAIANIKLMNDGYFNSTFNEKMLSKKDQTAELYKNIKSMQDNIGRIVYNLKENINNINSSIDTIQYGSKNLSDRTTSQAASLEELSASTESLSNSLRNTSVNTEHAKNMSLEVANSTLTGVEAVNVISNNMAEISESSKQISDITKLIQSIAFQTNILALNASVEAARAGEQGRGFAVVASEVRSLAQTVNEAANNITKIVNDTVAKIEHGNESVAHSTDILQKISSSAKEVVDVLTEISTTAINEQNSIMQINQTIISLNSITQENSSIAEDSANSSNEVKNMTEDIVNDINYFKFSER